MDDVAVAYLFLCIIYLQYLQITTQQRRIRQWSVRPINEDGRYNGYFQTTFLKIKSLDPQQFFIHTRLTLPLYNLLLEILKDALGRRDTCVTVGPEELLSLTLLHLAHGVSHQALAWSLKLGKTTVRNVILDTCEVIWQTLAPTYVSEPTESQYVYIAGEFERLWNLPNCVGAIDGKHIALKRPKNAGSSFYTYKKFHSIVLMATCDARYKFTSISIGSYGSHSDGGMFQVSPFGQKLYSNTLPLPPDKLLNNSEVLFPHYFVRDAAFPLRNNLMRPYPGQKLNKNRRIFNYRLSRARRCIENTFGILTARWRILLNTLEVAPENCEKIVLACVGLHNFIMLNDHQRWYCPDKFADWETEDHLTHDGDWRELLEESQVLRPVRMYNRHASSVAFQLRDTLASYLNKEGAIPFQNHVMNLIYGE